MFRIVLRKFGLLFLLFGFFGGGLGAVSGAVLLDPPPRPLYESTVEAVVLSEGDSRVLARALMSETFFFAQTRWLLPSSQDEGSRAATVADLLALLNENQKVSENLDIPMSEALNQIEFEARAGSDVLLVSLYEKTLEQAETEIDRISILLAEVDGEFYPGASPAILLDTKISAPRLSPNFNLSELREVKRAAVIGLGSVLRSSVEPDLDNWAEKVKLLYSTQAADRDRFDVSESASLAQVTISPKTPNRLVGQIRAESIETTEAEASFLAGAFEMAGQLAAPFDKAGMVVVLSSTGPLTEVNSPSINRFPVIVGAGVVVGLLVAGLFVMASFARDRVLWVPSQLLAITGAAPIGVVPDLGKGGDDSSWLENSGVTALRTNLFVSHTDERPVMVTSSASSQTHVDLAKALAESLAELGGTTALLDATPRGQGSPLPPSSAPRDRVLEAPLGVNSDFVNIVAMGSHSFDTFLLDPQVSSSPNFYLSKEWPAIMQALHQGYNYVVVAVGTVLAHTGVTEALLGDVRTLLVVEPGVTRTYDLAAGLVQLESALPPPPLIAVVGVPREEVPFWYVRPDKWVDGDASPQS